MKKLFFFKKENMSHAWCKEFHGGAGVKKKRR
jgi:hypothetical protein